MLKNYKKWLEIDKKEKVKYLQSLTLKKSARITERLLSHEVIKWFNFSDDDNATSISVFLARCRKKG